MAGRSQTAHYDLKGRATHRISRLSTTNERYDRPSPIGSCSECSAAFPSLQCPGRSQDNLSATRLEIPTRHRDIQRYHPRFSVRGRSDENLSYLDTNFVSGPLWDIQKDYSHFRNDKVARAEALYVLYRLQHMLYN